MEKRAGRAGSAKGRAHRTASRQPTPHELRVFVRLSEDLHFGRTARGLGLAQSSLSETIRRLEAKLEVVLFERTSRRVELTDAGADLIPVARDVLDRLAAARAAVESGPRAATDDFRIGIEPPGFAELNRPMLAEFVASRPDLAVVVRECVGFPQAFIDRALDVAIMRTPMNDERMTSYPLASEARGVVVSAEHPAAGTEGSSIHDYLDEPFVGLVPHVPMVLDYWVAQEHRGGEKPRIGGHASTAADTTFAIGYLGLATVGCPSFVRAYPLAGMGFIDTTDLSPNPITVVTRRGDVRPEVLGFVEVVRSVVMECDGLAAGISPVDDRVPAIP